MSSSALLTFFLLLCTRKKKDIYLFIYLWTAEERKGRKERREQSRGRYKKGDIFIKMPSQHHISKTINVPLSQLPMWEEAKRKAELKGSSMSVYMMSLLEEAHNLSEGGRDVQRQQEQEEQQQSSSLLVLQPADNDIQGWIKRLDESTDLGFIDQIAKEYTQKYFQSQSSGDNKKSLQYKSIMDIANKKWREKKLQSFRRPRQ